MTKVLLALSTSGESAVSIVIIVILVISGLCRCHRRTLIVVIVVVNGGWTISGGWRLRVALGVLLLLLLIFA